VLLFAFWGAGTIPVSAQIIRFVRNDNGVTRYNWSNGIRSLRVEIAGEIGYTWDDTDIAFLSQDGYVEIVERNGLRRRRLEIEPQTDGSLTHTYYRSGRRRDFDSEAKEWLAGLLPRIIRETGIGAEGRVKRILEQDGVDGVIDEIQLIESSSINVKYAICLLELGDLNATGLNSFAGNVIETIPSSGDKSRLLIHSAGYFMDHPSTSDAYFHAVSTVSSSGDHTRVLINLIDHYELSSTQFNGLLTSAEKISSSGDKSRVLISAAPSMSDDGNICRSFFRAVNSVSSSGDHMRVLLSLLEESGEIGQETIRDVFLSAKEIASSGDKTRVLTAAASRYVNSETHRTAFFDAADSIPSSGDHMRVLLSLLENDDLDVASISRLLISARGIASSGDKTRVLIAAAGRVAENDELVDTYLEVAETIGSSGDKSRALEALLR